MGSQQGAEEIDYADAEHICLEGERIDTASSQESGAVCFDTTIKRMGHSEWARLTLFDQGLLRVRRGSRRKTRADYTVDVRFVDPAGFMSRRVAWRWLGAGAGLLITGAATLWGALSWAAAPWWLTSLAAVVIAAGIVSCLIFAHRTGDRLRFASVHGRAELLQINGGLGLARRLKTFSAALKACVTSARNSGNIHQPGFLRDEMREHQRLRIEGILSDEDFEQAKVRILSAHG